MHYTFFKHLKEEFIRFYAHLEFFTLHPNTCIKYVWMETAILNWRGMLFIKWRNEDFLYKWRWLSVRCSNLPSLSAREREWGGRGAAESPQILSYLLRLFLWFTQSTRDTVTPLTLSWRNSDWGNVTQHTSQSTDT